jgi:peptidoglycan/LPS O-acetylase OafA/YrhL
MGLLRFLLALSVLASHSGKIFGLQFTDSMVAVQTFFIISGFYISFILNEKYIGLNSFRVFIVNRFLRLFPIYWFILILTVSACFLFQIKYHYQWQVSCYYEYIHSNNFSVATFLGLIFTNLFIFGQDILNFFGMNATDGSVFFTTNYLSQNPQLNSFLFVPQAWSISLELMFYIIAPLILTKKLPVIISIIITSILLRYIFLTNGFNPNPWNYMFFPSELAFFLSGYISYFIYKKIKEKNISSIFLKSIFVVMIGFTIFFEFIMDSNFKISLYYLIIVFAIPFLFKLTRNNAIDRYVGELSYPIYISHIFVLMFVGTNHFFTIESKATTLALCTILFSMLINKFISAPIEKIRQGKANKYLVHGQ